MLDKATTFVYRRLRTSNRFLLFLTLLCFFWILYVIKVQLDFQRQHVNKNYLRERIIELSKEYVRVIAKEREEETLGIDGQSNFELKDLRQTTAILLQNMLDRLQVLEKQVDSVISQSAQDISQLSQQLKSLNNSIMRFNLSQAIGVDDCHIPEDPLYPDCAVKVKWLENNWKSDIKFVQNGVNGTICSFLHYLSKVEHFCPSLERKSSTNCVIPNNSQFPECKNRVQWLSGNWKSDIKFANSGVDGSLCSILVYLSEIETWCPKSPDHVKAYDNDCKVPQDNAFPNCKVKVAWMRTSWKTHPCYAEDYGVNGTTCSFLYYLSEVENWCPRIFKKHSDVEDKIVTTEYHGEVNINDTSMEKLLDRLTKVVSESRLSWIRLRIARMYGYWKNALHELQTRVNVTGRPKKRVLVYIGVLAEEKTLHFAETAGKGGPLGELVQWSDLISSLYVLGHEVIISVDHMEAVGALEVDMKRSCPVKGSLRFDLIFTDYNGLKILKKKSQNIMVHYGCRLRILDSFGTEVQFNFNGPLPRYATPDGQALVKRNSYGKNNFNPKQYMTMFPHSPDNTFLGFVVDSKNNVPKTVKKKPQALAYGKHYYMWRDLKSRGFLDAIHEHFEIHATTGGMDLEAIKKFLPDYVINHGVLTPDKLEQLLRESKLFIGLGFPYEGPAPLEAIAQGCFFLNPKFNPPKSRVNTKFFQGKPTFRSLTSQHPYAEEFIGEPRVLTVNIDDVEAVKAAVKKVSESESSPYLPFEYTHEGMLERVNALVHNLDLCSRDVKWPPLSSRKVLTGKEGESCRDICLRNGLICEPAFFPSINSVDVLKKTTFPCDTDKPITRPSLVAPAYVSEDKACVLQKNPILYSCTVSHSSIRRICPCRDYRRGQVALCKTCY